MMGWQAPGGTHILPVDQPMDLLMGLLEDSASAPLVLSSVSKSIEHPGQKEGCGQTREVLWRWIPVRPGSVLLRHLHPLHHTVHHFKSFVKHFTVLCYIKFNSA